MSGYKSRMWCNYKDCVKYSPEFCDRVLSYWDLKRLNLYPMPVSYYGEKPKCFFPKNKECKCTNCTCKEKK